MENIIHIISVVQSSEIHFKKLHIKDDILLYKKIWSYCLVIWRKQ